MKLIKIQEDSVACGTLKNGKTKWGVMKTEKEVPFEEILTFNIGRYGQKINSDEDRSELFEFFLKRIVSQNPEIFKDYLEICCQKSNSLYHQYRIKE